MRWCKCTSVDEVVQVYKCAVFSTRPTVTSNQSITGSFFLAPSESLWKREIEFHTLVGKNPGKKTTNGLENTFVPNIQGVHFNWNPPKFSKNKIPYKLAQNFTVPEIVKEFVFVEFRGVPVKLDALYISSLT